MSEVNENVQNETQETAVADNSANMQIEIKEGGKVKKVLKWIVGGVALIATGIAGVLLGRSMGKDDEEDSAEAEAPTDE